MDRDRDDLYQADLCSYTKMVVVGRCASIINDADRRAEVRPFTSDYESLSKLPLFDTAIRYDCPCSEETYLLIVRNVLSVTAMDDNLMPLCIIRKS